MTIPLRPRVTDELLASVAARSTDRDRYLCEMLVQHRVLTTDHINDIAFGSQTTTRHRIRQLYDMRVVDRFRPFRFGNVLPFHYVIDQVGVEIVASMRGVDPSEIPWKRDNALRLATNSHLDHLVGVNGFFAALTRAGRSLGEGEGLVEWWSENRCRAEWGELVRPDGFGTWCSTGREVQFFLEYDRSSEPLERVAAKLDGYQRLMSAMGADVPVLFWFQGARREAGFRKFAGSRGLTIGTASGNVTSASDAVWLLNDECRRVRIEDCRSDR